MKRELFRKPALWLAALLCALGILVTAGVFFLFSSRGQRYIRSMVENKLTAALGRPCEIDSLDTDLIRFVELRGVRVLGGKEGLADTLLSAHRIFLQYNLTDLFKSRFTLHEVIVDRLDLLISRDSTGRLDFPGLVSEPSQSQDSTSIEFFLHSLSINDAGISYHDNKIPLQAELRNIGLILSQSQPYNYVIETNAVSGRFDYAGINIPFGNLNICGSLTDTRLTADSIQFQLPGLNCTGVLELDYSADPVLINGNLMLEGKMDSCAVAFGLLLPDYLKPLEGDIRADIRLSGPPEGFSVHSRLEIEDTKLGMVEIPGCRMSLAYRDNSIVLDSLKAVLLDGSLFANGTLILDSLLSARMELQTKRMGVEQFAKLFKRPEFPGGGRINLEAGLSGPLKKLEKIQAEAGITLSELSYGSRILPVLSAEAVLSGREGRLKLEQGSMTAEAVVSLYGEKLSGSYTANIQHLADVSPLFGITGLSGKLNIRGTLEGPAGELSLDASMVGYEIRYHNFPADSLRCLLSYSAADGIYIHSAFILGEIAALESLEPPLFVQDLSGGFAYQCEIKGSVDNPSVELQGYFKEPGYDYLKFDSGRFTLELKDRQVRLNGMQLVQDSLTVNLEGGYDIDNRSGTAAASLLVMPPAPVDLPSDIGSSEARESRGEIEVEFDFSTPHSWEIAAAGKGLKLSTISFFSTVGQGIAGSANLALSFSGSLEKPDAYLDLAADSLSYSGVTLDSLRGYLGLSGNRLMVDSVAAYRGLNRSTARGEIWLTGKPGEFPVFDKQSRVSLEMDAQNFELELLKFLLPPQSDLSGSANLSLIIEGTLNEPSLTGRVSIAGGRLLSGPGKPALDSLQADIIFADSLFEVNRIGAWIGGNPFELTGTVRYRGRRSFKMDLELAAIGKKLAHIAGNLNGDEISIDTKVERTDISMLYTFIPDCERLSGYLTADISLTGALTEPELDGKVTLDSLELKHVLSDTPLTGDRLVFHFDKQNLVLDSTQLRLGGGTILLQGHLFYKGENPGGLGLVAAVDGVRIEKSGQYLIGINTARLGFSNQDNGFVLDGDIVLGNTRITHNFTPREALGLFRKVELPSKEPSELFKRTKLNIHLHESDSLWINTNLAWINLRSDLHFIGTLAQPNVTGRIAVIQGEVYYLDHKFQITRGTLDFVNPSHINPITDLRADTKVSSYSRMEATNYIVSMELSGPVEQASFRLISDPPLDRADIVSLLTLGVTRQQLTARDTEGKTSIANLMKERLSDLSSQKISEYLTNNVAGTIGLDKLTVEGNIFRTSKESTTRLSASENISDRLGITYSTNVGHLNEQSVRLDYRLSKYFFLEGKTDQRGRSSAVLKYRLRFK